MMSTIFWDIMPCRFFKVTWLATCSHAGILLSLFYSEDVGNAVLKQQLTLMDYTKSARPAADLLRDVADREK
jgi:hypothetical protein